MKTLNRYERDVYEFILSITPTQKIEFKNYTAPKDFENHEVCKFEM